MGKPLKSPPVFFTVLQVRFNPVLQLDQYLAAIQERFRKAGYPAFTPRQTIAINLAFGSGETLAPQPVVQKFFSFATADRQHAFVVNSETITLQSTAYGTFEKFSSAFLRGLSIIHDEVQLDYTERVGLRYLDHILPKRDEPLESYLTAEVQGLRSVLGGELSHSFTETVSLMGKVTLRCRAVIQKGALAFPPDLSGHDMAVEERFLSASGLHAILDTDGFTEQRQSFDVRAVEDDMNSIHEAVRKAFSAAVTPHALSVWDE